ncbi:MAG TPA: protealysin inhibitor emfourin [Anaerolineales bacterium]
MRIQFERSGGFAGLLVQTTVDTDSRPPPEADKLVNLVEEANFFDLPAQITSPSPGADQFQYKVTVEEGDQRHTVEISEPAAPDALRPLLRELTLRARSS